MKALVPTKALTSQFLFWALNGSARSLVSLADESAHGTRKLETEVLARFPVLVPSLSER